MTSRTSDQGASFFFLRMALHFIRRESLLRLWL